MAALEGDHLVVRIVYAGAPLAGKTATVRALMPLLKGPGAERLVMSPAEHRGRTAFFDWADYVGGAFQGRPIHCQVASAPGQVALSDRRELLVRGSDAVILVVDSREEAIERTIQCYEEMVPWLEEAGQDAPIRVLLQCNKQDLAGSLPPQELSEALGLPVGRDVYGTSARTTKGLRAAFVAGVRAAVERAKLLLDSGLIASAPDFASGEELLARMQLNASLREAPPRKSAARPIEAPPPEVEKPRAARRAPAGRAASGRAAGSVAGSSVAGSSVAGSRAVVGRASTTLSAAPSSAAPTRTAASRTAPSRTAAAGPAASKAAAGSSARTASAVADSPTLAPTASRVRRPQAQPELAAELPEPAPSEPPTSSQEVRRQAPPPRQARDDVPAAPASERTPPKLWVPGSGPRPAILPASAYFSLVGPPSSRDEEEAWSVPAPKPSAAPAPVKHPPAPRPPADAAAISAAARAWASGAGPRPAILPASAYFALLPRPTAPSPAVEALPREPLPREALPREALPREALPPESLPLVVAAARLEPAQNDLTESAALESLEPVRRSERSQRPAILPMKAWLSGHWTSQSAAPRVSARPSRARLHVVSNARPAVMPMSAWLAQERSAAERSAAASAAAVVNDEGADVSARAAANVDAIPPSGPFASLSPPEEAPVSEAPQSSSAPRLPGLASACSSVPLWTWPRATWRKLSPELSADVVPRQDSQGRFIGEIAPGWYARSIDTGSVAERAGRRCFARAVLRQRTLRSFLSGPRCLALTEEGDRFWVWQIVYRVPTLAGTLGRLLDGAEEPGAVADALLEVASGYVEAREAFAAAPEPLPVSLQALSRQEGRFVYAGLLPKSDTRPRPPGGDGGAALGEALRKRWPSPSGPSVDADAVWSELQRKAAGRLPDPIVEIIRDVLIRH